MTKPDEVRSDFAPLDPAALNEMSEQEFLKIWKAIVGEAPAIMLASRADMVRILLATMPAAKSAQPDIAIEDHTKTELPEP